MSTRAESVAKAKQVLQEVTEPYETARKAYEAAHRDLRIAEESFDPGEKVRVEEDNCGRGCCTTDWIGFVVRPTGPKEYGGNYVVREQNEGKEHRVWRSEMTRLSK